MVWGNFRIYVFKNVDTRKTYERLRKTTIMSVKIFNINAHEIPRTNHCLVVDLDSTFVNTNKFYTSIQRLDIDQMQQESCARDSRQCQLFFNVKQRIYDIHTIDSTYSKGSGVPQSFWGVERPGLQPFLTFASMYFDTIAVWSAGVASYVHGITNYIFRNVPYPALIFDRSHTDFDRKNNAVKPLTRIYHHCAYHYGECKGTFTPEHTFVLDDTVSTFSENQGNGIHIPKYEPDDSLEALAADDKALEKLTNWLLRPEVITSTDVRRLEKSTIFL